MKLRLLSLVLVLSALLMNPAFAEETEKWIIPSGQEESISAIFDTPPDTPNVLVESISIMQDKLVIGVSSKGSAATISIDYGWTLKPSPACGLMGRMRLCVEGSDFASSPAALEYHKWLGGRGIKLERLDAIWKKINIVSEQKKERSFAVEFYWYLHERRAFWLGLFYVAWLLILSLALVSRFVKEVSLLISQQGGTRKTALIRAIILLSLALIFFATAVFLSSNDLKSIC